MAAAVLGESQPGVESNRATFQVRITNLIRGLWRSPTYDIGSFLAIMRAGCPRRT
jgi:hypothetical protein